MKRLILICSLVVLVAALASTAKATAVNPAEWDFSLESYGSDDFWTSSTNVYTGYPQYDYVWELTYAELYLNNIWFNVLGYIDPPSGSGSANGLPFDVLDQGYLESGIFGVDLHCYVDGSGFGHVDATNVYFGSFGIFSVDGFKGGGHVTVTAVPEPATVLLLGLGALALLRKRRV
jgi:hypothetical protein